MIIPTGPPEAPWVEKWLIFGISTPSKKKRFSEGPPPLTIKSLRNAAVDAPGKVCTTREMSRFPPALFSISLKPITRSPSGLSAVLRNGEATTLTSCRFWLASSSSIGKNISLFANSNYGVGITGKLNKKDEHNDTGSDNIVYISIYDKDNNKFYNETVTVTKNERYKNKQKIIDKIILMMENLLSNIN